MMGIAGGCAWAQDYEFDLTPDGTLKVKGFEPQDVQEKIRTFPKGGIFDFTVYQGDKISIQFPKDNLWNWEIDIPSSANCVTYQGAQELAKDFQEHTFLAKRKGNQEIWLQCSIESSCKLNGQPIEGQGFFLFNVTIDDHGWVSKDDGQIEESTFHQKGSVFQERNIWSCRRSLLRDLFQEMGITQPCHMRFSTEWTISLGSEFYMIVPHSKWNWHIAHIEEVKNLKKEGEVKKEAEEDSFFYDDGALTLFRVRDDKVNKVYTYRAIECGDGWITLLFGDQKDCPEQKVFVGDSKGIPVGLDIAKASLTVKVAVKEGLKQSEGYGFSSDLKLRELGLSKMGATKIPPFEEGKEDRSIASDMPKKDLLVVGYPSEEDKYKQAQATLRELEEEYRALSLEKNPSKGDSPKDPGKVTTSEEAKGGPSHDGLKKDPGEKKPLSKGGDSIQGPCGRRYFWD